ATHGDAHDRALQLPVVTRGPPLPSRRQPARHLKPEARRNSSGGDAGVRLRRCLSRLASHETFASRRWAFYTWASHASSNRRCTSCGVGGARISPPSHNGCSIPLETGPVTVEGYDG